jgi:hypothetical protein
MKFLLIFIGVTIIFDMAWLALNARVRFDDILGILES